MSAVRAVWNGPMWRLVGSMSGCFVYSVLATPAQTIFGPLSTTMQFSLGLGAWLLGGSVAFVMFVSYYLDDSRD